MATAELETILREALAAFDGNMAALAREVELTPSSVGRWYAGQTKPDEWSCLALAGIVGRSAESVLLAAGHKPDRLRVARQQQPEPEADEPMQPRIPIRVRQESLIRSHEIWVKTLGPKLGYDVADDLFWKPILASAQDRAAISDQLQSAVNPAQPGADKVGGNVPAGGVRPATGADDDPLIDSYGPVKPRRAPARMAA